MFSKKIAIVICYFGRFPWYFDYFLHSCQFNLSIDFFIITDINTYDKPLPPNVKFVFKTIDDIVSMASEKLGFPVKIDFSYKLCDLKPAYGLIFSELIEGYDYWGQSDLDIIYGNIRKFITDDMLTLYDFISIRHDYTTGCFALYKNNDFMNNFFKRSKDYKMVFSSVKHYCFDECNFKHDLLTDGASIFEVDAEIESFTHIIKVAEEKQEIKAHFDFILLEGVPGKIRFDNGGVFYKEKFEGILYHLYWLKRVYTPKVVPACIPDNYYISTKKIHFNR
jgi:hypothetical protein